MQNKPRLGQGRAGLRRKMKNPVHTQTQLQTSEEGQVTEHILSKQKEVVQPPHPTKWITDRSLGHIPESSTTPVHIIRSRMNMRHVPFNLIQ